MAADPIETVNLTPFEGRQVARAKVILKKAGDGLSESMAVAPVEIHHGETGYIVIEWVCADVGFKPVKDTELLERVHTLNAVTAFFADDKRVATLAAAHEKRMDKIRGVAKLPFDEPKDESSEAEGDESE